MIKYYVLDANGQKYGPAEVPLLNQWITEGRLTPDSMLQDFDTGVQTRASLVPALKFHPTPPPAGPSLATPGANPYDYPRPTAGPGPQPFKSGYTPPHLRGTSNMGGQMALAWGLTALTPVLIYYISFGFVLSFWGIRAGIAFIGQGMKGQGIALIVINALWMVFYIYMRVTYVSHY